MSSGQDFILDTDASDFATGSVLSQIQDGNEKPIAYFSKTMSKQERRYCITRKELLAVVQSVKHFHHYLYGTRFLIRTDHAALKWLMSFKHPEGQTARWLEILGTYTFEISHRPGRFHGNADGLSRRPCSDDCQHCTRTETGDIDRDGPMEFKTHKWKRKKNRSSDGCDRSNGTVDGETKETKQVAAVSSSTEPPRPWLQKWTNQELKAEQLKDVELRKMLTWKENKVDRPSWEEVSAEGKELKAYWAQWDRLEVRQGLLCRRWENHAGDCIHGSS
ncbi:Retrovirus-related Pol polyprotein from transposon [Apostichopus japonicus]|uniref:Retrovirus-related Pol polyprotein from transposon n=1 Tax=Stichopus japonicus TaxID=307972 RepID=A0A2G8JVM9_STIJA|nr:Retrovirus-related Pol polyprotein from transposon [Apostichopus japonicus]